MPNLQAPSSGTRIAHQPSTSHIMALRWSHTKWRFILIIYRIYTKWCLVCMILASRLPQGSMSCKIVLVYSIIRNKRTLHMYILFSPESLLPADESWSATLKWLCILTLTSFVMYEIKFTYKFLSWGSSQGNPRASNTSLSVLQLKLVLDFAPWKETEIH